MGLASDRACEGVGCERAGRPEFITPDAPPQRTQTSKISPYERGFSRISNVSTTSPTLMSE